MNPFNRFSDVRLDEMATVVARETGVDRRQVKPYANFTEMLTELLHLYYQPSVRLVTAGATIPEIAQAAHIADIELTERLGVSPFTGDVDSLLQGITSTSDIIYVANPNRVTGAHFSNRDLWEMANAVPDGLVIVDEHFQDYFGPTAMPLTDLHSNMVVIRSITTAPASSESGYLLANPIVIDRIGEACPGRSFSTPDRQAVVSCLADDAAREHHLVEVQDEALRLAQELNRIGVQCRICPTNFVLLRVASPTMVGNRLSAAEVPVSNLDGYPQLKNYLRYEIRSRLLNDSLLVALREMPEEFVKMPRLDRRASKLAQGSAKKKTQKARSKELAHSG